MRWLSTLSTIDGVQLSKRFSNGLHADGMSPLQLPEGLAPRRWHSGGSPPFWGLLFILEEGKELNDSEIWAMWDFTHARQRRTG